jgi:hypothetical protein
MYVRTFEEAIVIDPDHGLFAEPAEPVGAASDAPGVDTADPDPSEPDAPGVDTADPDPSEPDAAASGTPRPAASEGVTPSPEKDPSDWVTGDEPMTGPQASYLSTLAQEAGREVPTELTKADASRLIDELQEQTGRGR